jgi:hypothetical protein
VKYFILLFQSHVQFPFSIGFQKHIFKLFRFIAIQQQHLYYFFVLNDKEHQLFAAAGFHFSNVLYSSFAFLPTSVVLSEQLRQCTDQNLF